VSGLAWYRIWLLATLLGVALGLSVAARGDGVVRGDRSLARWIQRRDGGSIDALVAFGNALGDFWVGALVAVAAAVALALARRWPEVALLVAVVAIRALGNQFKRLFDSPRPTPDLLRVTETADGLGFPSGNAMGTTLLLGVLVWAVSRSGARDLVQRLTMAGAVALALVVGVARVHAGVHWPSDVLGGYLWGAIALLVLIWLAERPWPAWARRTPSS